MDTEPQIWLEHFEYHARRRSTLPPAELDDLTSYERRLIADSIATFQLGEQSEGRTLQRSAQRYEAKRNAAPIAKIIALIIAEEQHHATLLGAFMDQNGIARKRHDWTDSAFRFARRLGGFELHLSVLIAAELIGKVYYRALEGATGSRQLRTLCRMIVADELAHVGFESDVLRAMHARKAPLLRATTLAVHRTFFMGTAAVVWLTHGAVLRAAGYRLRTFLRACSAQYAFYLESPSMTSPTPTRA